LACLLLRHLRAHAQPETASVHLMMLNAACDYAPALQPALAATAGAAKAVGGSKLRLRSEQSRR